MQNFCHKKCAFKKIVAKIIADKKNFDDTNYERSLIRKINRDNLWWIIELSRHCLQACQSYRLIDISHGNICYDNYLATWA